MNMEISSMTQHKPTQVKPTYVCRACHKHFVREVAYMAHECKQLKREKELKTPTGQAAWLYYHQWMRLKKRMPPTPESFLDSKYFRTFINFTLFTRKISLPLPDRFIRFAVKHDFQPTLWTNDTVYTRYIEYIDQTTSPIDQAKMSITTILDFADNHHIDTSEVFDRINPNELIHLIRIRKLSPWLLLSSRKFAILFMNMTEEQHAILETLIKPNVWALKQQQHGDEVKVIKQYVAEMGL